MEISNTFKDRRLILALRRDEQLAIAVEKADQVLESEVKVKYRKLIQV